MEPAEYWIEHLSLQPHPEGGFYRELYRASEDISANALPAGLGDRGHLRPVLSTCYELASDPCFIASSPMRLGTSTRWAIGAISTG